LTNRDWRFDAADLARRLGLDPGAGRVRLINDLTALGHGLRGLHGAALLPVHAPAAGAADAEGAPPGNGQALVLGLGTGANACAVRDLGQLGALCLEAEAGHAALPAPVMAALAAAVGAGRAAGFDCVEALFSGRGLTRLHACLTGPPEGAAPLSGSRIVGAARGGDAAALETVTLFARMLGLYARDLGLIFLPREGLYLAGSVARGVLTGGGGAAFRAAFAGGVGPFAAIVRAMPVRLIADDMAALAGCLNALRAAV
jgi:glucokinase